jgi:hypothetical protein
MQFYSFHQEAVAPVRFQNRTLLDIGASCLLWLENYLPLQTPLLDRIEI